MDCLGVKISYTGELGWEFYMPLDKMKPVYDAFMEQGQDLGLGHFGTFVVNVLRLEKGFKMWGSEMNCDGTILEAGLDAFVRWKKKSNFIGKESLLQKKNEWFDPRVVMLEVDNAGNSDPEGNESVWLADRVNIFVQCCLRDNDISQCFQVIGNTTSGCYSPALGKGLAFAYVPAMCSVPGSELDIEVMGIKRPARVLEGPPVLTQPQREAAASKKK